MIYNSTPGLKKVATVNRSLSDTMMSLNNFIVSATNDTSLQCTGKEEEEEEAQEEEEEVYFSIITTNTSISGIVTTPTTAIEASVSATGKLVVKKCLQITTTIALHLPLLLPLTLHYHYHYHYDYDYY